MSKLSVIVALAIAAGCSTESSNITIVNIEHHDRVTLGKQIRVIQKLNPKLIALDVFFLADSLDVDTVLMTSLKNASNLVQIVALRGEKREDIYWDSLRTSNEKFRFGAEGFSNLSVFDISAYDYTMVLPELPLQQFHNDEAINSFCYVIAEKSFGLKDKYKSTGADVVHFDKNIFAQKIKTLTISNIIAGKFSKDDFEGKIVMLGHIGSESDDYENSFYLNAEQTEVISSVEIHACLVSQLIK